MHEPNLLDLARRFLAVAIYFTTLFFLILATMPFVHVQAQLVAQLGEIHPVLAVVGSGFGVFFFLKYLTNPRYIFELPIELIDEVLKRVFDFIGSRICALTERHERQV